MGHDRTDFAEFYARSRDGCLRAVLASVGDMQTAEELVAEAFARALAGWRKVRKHPAPRAWVVRTALNLNVSAWRRRRRELPIDGHDAPAPATGLDRVDAELMAALLRLPARQREVVALRIFLDLDTARTAEVLGIAPGTVTAHLARAIAALRGEFLTAQRQED